MRRRVRYFRLRAVLVHWSLWGGCVNFERHFTWRAA